MTTASASTAGGTALEPVRNDAAINRQFAIEQAQAPAIADSENPDGQSPSPRDSKQRGPNPRSRGDDGAPDDQNDPGAPAAAQTRITINKMSGTAPPLAGAEPAVPAAQGNHPTPTAEMHPKTNSIRRSSTFARPHRAVVCPKMFHPNHPWRARTGDMLSCGVPALFLVFSAASGSARDEPLRVRAEAGRGPFFVGQGIEVRLTVVGGRNRPTIELPPFPAADAWLTGTEKRPISRSEIGSIVGEENQFLMRIRVVPTRSGTLQIPSIAVRVEQTFRAQPKLARRGSAGTRRGPPCRLPGRDRAIRPRGCRVVPGHACRPGVRSARHGRRARCPGHD